MFFFDIDWAGLILPTAYLAVLVGSLMTFSSVYRKRRAVQAARLAPWFPPHLQRNIYLSLLHMNPDNSETDNKAKAARIPESVIRAALLRRAVEDIHRLIQVRNSKQALTALQAKGSVGDDLLQRFQRAEKEMEDELRDVVMEANALAPNWGKFIFQSANEIAANEAFRSKLEDVEGQTEADTEWWEKRRATIREELLQEVENEKAAAK